VQVDAICTDLAAEHAALDVIVAGLDDEEWETPTPAEPWAVRHQIGHLTFYDRTATRAIVDPEGFNAWLATAMDDPGTYMVEADGIGIALTGGALLDTWREGRAALLDALRPLDPAHRIPWYGPPMSARSFATARLMETWAHGQDVVDGLRAAGHADVDRPATARLRNIAHLGVVTRGWSYRVRLLEPPAEEVRVALTPPDGGDEWTWGDESAPASITGPAVDWCLVVTQRRHPADTALVAHGAAAEGWLAVAQAFAGPPGDGRAPLRSSD
jgi:uncharacterized protein (TIGR03084 family)